MDKIRRSPALYKGFTLLELVTVIAIIGLLTLSSYPTYTHHLLKTHRVEAQVGLLDLAAALDRYYMAHNTYEDATLANLEINEDTPNHYYHLEIADLTEGSYSLRAVPTGPQAKDSECGTFTLNQLGERGSSSNGEDNHCW